MMGHHLVLDLKTEQHSYIKLTFPLDSHCDFLFIFLTEEKPVFNWKRIKYQPKTAKRKKLNSMFLWNLDEQADSFKTKQLRTIDFNH